MDAAAAGLVGQILVIFLAGQTVAGLASRPDKSITNLQ
jgi:hypothetical protein